MSKWNQSIYNTTTDGFTQVRDLDYQYTGKLVRNPYHGPSTPKVDDWRDEAACQDGDPSLFEYDNNESRESQWDSIHAGMLICNECPVRALCYDDSSPANRYWTTRGGRPPEGMFTDSVAPKEKSLITQAGGRKSEVAKKRTPKERCKRNHNNWVLRKNGSRQCKDCYTLHNRARYGKKDDTVES